MISLDFVIISFVFFSILFHNKLTMQFLVPAEKGINAKGERFAEFSFENLFGSNSSGFGQTSGSLFTKKLEKI